MFGAQLDAEDRPRATITASDSSRISSSRSIAAGFSIFASRAALPSIRRRASATSSGRWTKLSAIQSTSCSNAQMSGPCDPCRSARSAGRTTSGTFTPLRSDSSPPVRTSVCDGLAVTLQHLEPDLAIIEQQNLVRSVTFPVFPCAATGRASHHPSCADYRGQTLRPGFQGDRPLGKSTNPQFRSLANPPE